MTQPENESDFPTQPYTKTASAHACINDRRIRDIEREIKEARSRLGDGDVCLATLRLSVNTLKESVDRLNESVNELSKPSPIMQKIVDSFIQWAVPVGVMLIIWALVKSGAIEIKPDQPSVKTERVTP
jgi:hypothetical protein